jgi:predicted transcriptional regulator
MDQFNGSEHELPETLIDEDEATLAAIDEGIRAADEGRVTPADEVRKLIARWNSEFSTQSRR